MATSQWVYEIATDTFLFGGFFNPEIPPVKIGLWAIESYGESHPHPRLERHDAASPTKKRRATAAEIEAYDDAERARVFDADRRTRILLAWVLAEVNLLRAAVVPPLPPVMPAEVRAALLILAKTFPE